jgi:glycosyltransferase involved in cell wall biosynthesis
VLRLAAALRARGHQAHELQLPGPANLPGAVRAVARACREHAIDLVNAHSPRTTLVAGLARALRLSSAKLVTTVDGVQPGLRSRFARALISRLPDEVIFVSRAERDRLAEDWGRAVGQVVYTGVELPRPGAIEPIDLEAKHGVPRDARVIGCVGALTPEKAVGDAIAALVRLPPDVVLCIVGDGVEENALRAEARRRRVEQRVIFAGASREVDRYMVSFCALLLPSRAEDLPVALRDAGALSIPVIAADVGGVREVVVPRETGLLYPTGDVDGLVRAIRGMLEDPSRAAAMGCAARLRIANVFGVGRWADEIEALFARVARVD